MLFPALVQGRNAENLGDIFESWLGYLELSKNHCHPRSEASERLIKFIDEFVSDVFQLCKLTASAEADVQTWVVHTRDLAELD